MELGHAYSVLVVSASAKFNESVRGLLPERFYWPVTVLTDSCLPSGVTPSVSGVIALARGANLRKLMTLPPFAGMGRF